MFHQKIVKKHEFWLRLVKRMQIKSIDRLKKNSIKELQKITSFFIGSRYKCKFHQKITEKMRILLRGYKKSFIKRLQRKCKFCKKIMEETWVLSKNERKLQLSTKDHGKHRRFLKGLWKNIFVQESQKKNKSEFFKDCGTLFRKQTTHKYLCLLL